MQNRREVCAPGGAAGRREENQPVLGGDVSAAEQRREHLLRNVRQRAPHGGVRPDPALDNEARIAVREGRVAVFACSVWIGWQKVSGRGVHSSVLFSPAPS